MYTMYSKDGHEVRVAPEQVELMKAAGYTLEKPDAAAPKKK